MDFQQKKIARRIMYSKITIFLLFVLVIVFSRAVWNMYQKEEFSEQSLNSAKAEHDDLSSREKYLQNQINKLETEEGIEAEIRSKYSVAKEGEVSVLIVDKNASSENKTNKISDRSLWHKFFDLFTQ